MIAVATQLFLRREVLSKLTTILTFVCLLPAAVAAIALFVAEQGPIKFFSETSAVLYLNVLTALVPMFHAVAAFHEEFENRTIFYLLTRPPTRTTYVLAKYLTAWASSMLSIAIGIAVTTGLCISVRPDLVGFFAASAGELLVACALASAVYTSLFLVFGLWLRNPVLIGLLFTFGWENLITYFPGKVRYWTVGLYPRSFFIQWTEADPAVFGYEDASTASALATPSLGPENLSALAKNLAASQFEVPGLLHSLGVSLGLAAVLLAFAIYLFRGREDA